MGDDDDEEDEIVVEVSSFLLEYCLFELRRGRMKDHSALLTFCASYSLIRDGIILVRRLDRSVR